MPALTHWKVYAHLNGKNVLLASCADPQAAAQLAIFYGAGTTIRHKLYRGKVLYRQASNVSSPDVWSIANTVRVNFEDHHRAVHDHLRELAQASASVRRAEP